MIVINSYRYANNNIDSNYALRIYEGDDLGANRQNINFSDLANFSSNNGFSLEFRMYPLVFDSTGGVEIFFRIMGSNQLRSFVLSDKFYIQFIPENVVPNRSQRITASLVRNTWYHFLIAVDPVNQELRTYVNGVKYTITTNISGNPVDYTFQNITEVVYGSPITANSINPDGYHRGFRFFSDVAIGDSDAATLYGSDPKNIQPVPTALLTNLTKELKFNQKSGTDAIDTSSSAVNNPLTIGTSPDGWELTQLSEGGGAWVDVSGI